MGINVKYMNLLLIDFITIEAIISDIIPFYYELSRVNIAYLDKIRRFTLRILILFNMSFCKI